MQYLPYVELTTTDFSSKVTGVPLAFNTRFINKLTRMLPPSPTIVYFPSEFMTFNTYVHPTTEQWIDVPVSCYKINLTHNSKTYGDSIQFFRFSEDNSGYVICMGDIMQSHHIYCIYILRALLNLYGLESSYGHKTSITTNFGHEISYDDIKLYYTTFWGTDYPEPVIPFTKDHYKVLYTWINCFFISKQPVETININDQSYDPFEKIQKS